MLTSTWGGVFLLLMACGHVLAGTPQIARSQVEVQNTGALPKTQSAIETTTELSREFRNATVQWDAEFRIVRQLRGRVSVLGGKVPSEAAQLFLKKHKRQFTNSPRFDEFRQISEKRSLTGTSLGFARYHAGLPVIDDLLSIFIGKRMTILQINNNFTPIRTPLESGPLPVAKARAVAMALTAIGEQQTPVEQPAAILSVVVSNGVAVAVWKVTFKTRTPAAAWRVVVNAKSNQVIAKRNVALYSSK